MFIGLKPYKVRGRIMNILFLGVGLSELYSAFEFPVDKEFKYFICGDRLFNQTLIHKLHYHGLKYFILNTDSLYDVMLLPNWQWDHIYVHPSPNKYISNWIDDKVHVNVFMQHVLQKSIPAYKPSYLHTWDYLPMKTTHDLRSYNGYI